MVAAQQTGMDYEIELSYYHAWLVCGRANVISMLCCVVRCGVV